jgi:acyl carrier protein
MKDSKDSIEHFIISLIEKKSKLPKDCNLAIFDYIESGYVDSMGLIKFIVDIERKFDISILEVDMEDQRFRTIGGLVNIIYQKIENTNDL